MMGQVGPRNDVTGGTGIVTSTTPSFGARVFKNVAGRININNEVNIPFDSDTDALVGFNNNRAYDASNIWVVGTPAQFTVPGVKIGEAYQICVNYHIVTVGATFPTSGQTDSNHFMYLNCSPAASVFPTGNNQHNQPHFAHRVQAETLPDGSGYYGNIMGLFTVIRDDDLIFTVKTSIEYSQPKFYIENYTNLSIARVM